MDTPAQPYLVITFPSTHAALKFDSAFKEKGAAKLVPVPREISSSCGLAARLPDQDATKLVASLAALDVEYEEIYRLVPGAKPRCLAPSPGR
ncbi:MAG TPA: DUF3343 domain-containing protein [Firmicutes bacterium]|uniref:DUF3343 domain-containing protein n=1 Tax=Gelria sp. Kuro-4 TaxID=2796927 RepID=UPI00198A502C|nr:DUF3343 domain-containing protein [Gelria sp. Kuro-4]MDK2926358.1 hypothetical protein [Bacillota bacterium]BCV24697.1 hypothetical protein kuro4_14700 [Gelria sp. Kuro-4]HHV56999.1 DUF3343 domain-containing protein [Bacillota bacterium]